MRILDIVIKDIRQVVRDWRAATFLLIMPIAFTLLFGFAFGGFSAGNPDDQRLPVGYLDQDGSAVSGELLRLLQDSEVIRLESQAETVEGLQKMVADQEVAAAVVVPEGYGEGRGAGEGARLLFFAEPTSNVAFTAQSEVQSAASRLSSALHAARVSTEAYDAQVGFGAAEDSEAYFQEALGRAIEAWESPPVALETSYTGAPPETNPAEENAFGQSSPGMMAQFAIAGLTAAASILVLERKNGSLRRLLTMDISRGEVLLAHYLAMVLIIFTQLAILILFGQLFLQLDYFGAPLATFLLTVATALFTAGLGLLIGALARTEEQVIVFALIPMFVLAALGGAWVPLEITPEGFQRIAFVTPLAWVVDGFKDIIVRGQGLSAVWLSVVVLLAYALVMVGLAAWRFRSES